MNISLGSNSFKQDHGVKHAYMAGAMYRGIASKEMVVAMGKAQMLGSLGTGGMSIEEIGDSITYIQKQLNGAKNYSINLLCNPIDTQMEMRTVSLLLTMGVKTLEAAAFAEVTPALVLYRIKGLERLDDRVECQNKVIAKLSRPEVAEAFMNPAPSKIVQDLLRDGLITPDQATWSQEIPMSHDICVEADSGGHTDQGVAFALFPAIQYLRDTLMKTHQYTKSIRVGLAGGIGTPQAAASAFTLGADFIVTGSINQCTPESGAHPVIKDLLQDINVQDTAYAPAGDMFESGARVQVLRKGTLFPARANKLYALYTHYSCIEDIPKEIQDLLQTRYFKKSFDEIWQETVAYFNAKGLNREIEKAEKMPEYKMALLFRWYFGYSMRATFAGDLQNKANFQVATGPAMGSFNQWVKGTDLEPWRNRHVAVIAEKLMTETSHLLTTYFSKITSQSR